MLKNYAASSVADVINRRITRSKSKRHINRTLTLSRARKVFLFCLVFGRYAVDAFYEHLLQLPIEPLIGPFCRSRMYGKSWIKPMLRVSECRRSWRTRWDSHVAGGREYIADSVECSMPSNSSKRRTKLITLGSSCSSWRITNAAKIRRLVQQGPTSFSQSSCG